MTRTIACAGVLALLVMSLQPVASQTNALPMTVDQVVAKVIDTWTNTGFRIHATLTRTTPGTNVKQVRQVLIKGRRDRKSATVLYQQLWPKTVEGRALVIEDPGDHRPRGFLYEAGRVTRLTTPMLANRLFDSDIRLDDLAPGFWYWRSRRISGEEAIGEYRCVIVEFRPEPDTPTAYSLIKAWVALDLAVALRLEHFGRDGRLVKRIGLYRVVKVEKQALPAILTVEPADGRSRTVLEGVKLESDLNLPAADFTVEAIRKSVRTPE